MITVAVCTRDRPVPLERCLASLQPQIDQHSELLVVDSAPSGSGVRQIAEAAGARYIVTRRPGLDVARNLAVRAARGTIIAFVDDDVVASQTWLEALTISFADPAIDCVTGRILPLELRTDAQRYFEQRFSFDRGETSLRFPPGDARRGLVIHPWHLGSGCNMSFRRKVFDLVGPFDEALDAGTPIGGGGDLDMFSRVLRAGLIAVYNPAALVYHEHRAKMADSYRQFWGYGTTYTALLTKSWLIEGQRVSEVMRAFIAHIWKQRLRIARGAVRRQVSFRLSILELLGNLAGPAAYIRSLRRVQREWPHHLQPAQVLNLHLAHSLPEDFQVAEDHDLYLVVHRHGQPQGTLLLENPGPTVDRERFANLVRTLESQPSDDWSAQPAPQRLSIVVGPPKGRGSLDTIRKGLAGIDGITHELVVVTGDPDLRTEQVATEHPVQIVYEKGQGLSRAQNRGLVEARGDIVVFLDDDLIVDPGWPRAIVASFRDPSVSCVFGPVLPSKLETAGQRLLEYIAGQRRGFKRKRYRDSLTTGLLAEISMGANIAFRRDVLLRVGAFDEAFDQASPAQDCGALDAIHRLLKAGETAIYEPAMLTWRQYDGNISDVRQLQVHRNLGTAAVLTKWIIQGDLAMLRGTLKRLTSLFRQVGVSLLGSSPLPVSFPVAALCGMLLGPWGYVRARWQTRRHEPIRSTSRDCEDGQEESYGAESALSSTT